MTKTFTLRKISTGGLLIIEATSKTALFKRFDPSIWELVNDTPESEEQPSGNNRRDAGQEDN